MHSNPKSSGYLKQRGRVSRIGKWTQNRSLWEACNQFFRMGRLAIYTHCLGAMPKVAVQPCMSTSCDTIGGLKSLHEDVLVDSIKCSTLIQHDQYGAPGLIHCTQKIICNFTCTTIWLCYCHYRGICFASFTHLRIHRPPPKCNQVFLVLPMPPPLNFIPIR